MNKFIIKKHNQVHKMFQIEPPKNMVIEIYIDFDDVWHPKVNKEAKAIVKVLNNHLDELEEFLK